MKLSDMLASQPAPLSVPGARSEIRAALVSSQKPLAAILDDPGCSQTVSDTPIYFNCAPETLDSTFSSDSPAALIFTDSRRMSPDDAASAAEQIGRHLAAAATKADVEPLIASVGDGALRGHYSQELEGLACGLGRDFDGVIVVPAFFETGWYTIDDTQWALQDDQLIAANKTESARDSTFGFRGSDLKQWIHERTHGVVQADRVRSISLQTLRNGGPVAVENELLQASKAQTIIVNAACYEDLEIFALGLIAAELQGKNFIYRCSGSFLKVRGGFEDRPLVTGDLLCAGDGPGLLVAGSYADNTSRQLDALIQSKLAVGVELRVDMLLEDNTVEAEITRAAVAVNERLAGGDSTALYTSRKRHSISASGLSKIGRTIMSSLCEITRRIEVKPGFLVAKGEITSMEVVRSLGVKEALALGQVIPSVPVWKLGADSRWPDIAYMQLPGGVGGENALLDIFVRCDSARHSRILHLR
jgi:uncharacterized protein YgbK (DUF1537 family)